MLASRDLPDLGTSGGSVRCVESQIKNSYSFVWVRNQSDPAICHRLGLIPLISMIDCAFNTSTLVLDFESGHAFPRTRRAAWSAKFGALDARAARPENHACV